VRLPAFLLLRLAEPLVRIVLTALGLLSILIALFYRVASSLPRSPFWLCSDSPDLAQNPRPDRLA
jgi:hypothetical protein